MRCVHTLVRSVRPALSMRDPRSKVTPGAASPPTPRERNPGFSEYSQFHSRGRVGTIQAWTGCFMCSVEALGHPPAAVEA